MGTVYRAKHAWLGRTVAIKFISPEVLGDPEAVARFAQEARAIGALDHPNIVRATDAGCVDGVHYLVTEYVAGCDLAEVVKRRGPLSVANACLVVRQAALGLQHAHDRGLVHRDVKPSNLRLDPDGIVKLLDFGVARLTTGQTTMTTTGQMIGTLDYLAPEQASNPRGVDGRADIYSLGCTLYFLLTGEPPFHGPAYDTPASKIRAHLVDPPDELIENRCRHLPRGVAKCIERMMAKLPDDRFATAAEVAQVLERFVAGANPGELVEFDSLNPAPVIAPPRTSRGLLNALYLVIVVPCAWVLRRLLFRRRKRDSSGGREPIVSFAGLLIFGLLAFGATQLGSCHWVDMRNGAVYTSPKLFEFQTVSPTQQFSAPPQSSQIQNPTVTNSTGSGPKTITINNNAPEPPGSSIKYSIPKPRR